MPTEIRMYLITLLHQTLACTLDLHSQVRQTSWNIKGKDAAVLQTLCTAMAAALARDADAVAARIAVLGGAVMGTVRIVAAYSPLPEYPADLVEGTDHALALAECIAYHTKALRDALTAATDVEDAGTAALYTDILRRVEQQLWALETYLPQ
jgi:starvation-inducible DNA-binding protein